MMDFAQARRTMVDRQLRTFDITDRAVLAAMGEVAREGFVPAGREDLAYTDRETPLGHGRVMMAPMVLGRLIQALRIEPGMSVLDVGCGFGYASAVLTKLGARVVALETESELVGAARQRLAAEDVTVRYGPLPDGAAEAAPFDRILVNGTVETRPETLLGQLGDGGRLACVMASGGRIGKATLFVRSSGAIGATPLFDAHAPILSDFAKSPAFVF